MDARGGRQRRRPLRHQAPAGRIRHGHGGGSVGDTLYVWGISREVDTRTYFRSLPLAALGMEAEPVPVDPKPTDPTAPQTPATLDKLASTGDGSALWLIVGATAASGAIAAACAAYDERRQRQTRRPLR